MKKVVIGLVAVVVIVGAYFGLAKVSSSRVAAAAATPAPAQEPVKAGNKVVAEAKVMPVHHADLSFKAGGTVAEVLVAEGAHVDAGQPVIRLHAEQQAAAVAQAEADLQRAQARLDEQKAGAREQEIQSAQAAVDAAQAQLKKLTDGARPEDIAAAQAAVSAAQAELARVKQGADEQELISAAAEVANAEAAVRQAQTAYDQIKGRADAGAMPQSLELERATNNYTAAKARYDDLAKGPTAAAIAKAKAEVQRASAELNKAKAPARPAEIAAAEAEVRRAQAELELRKAGARTESLAVTGADVAAAEAALKRARADLSDTEIRAPFAGTVVALDAVVGEQVQPSTPVVRLGDLTTWQVETTDLTEINVVRVREGDAATVSFDAIPDLELAAKVSRIKGLGENKQGDIVYTVFITPEGQPDWASALSDGRLRWNMTAAASIEPRQ